MMVNMKEQEGQMRSAAMQQQSLQQQQGYGLAAFNERVRQKANGLKSPFVPSMTPDQARAVFQQRHGRSADTAQNIAHQSEPSAAEVDEIRCTTCRDITTHAASCGCGKCYGCCAT